MRLKNRNTIRKFVPEWGICRKVVITTEEVGTDWGVGDLVIAGHNLDGDRVWWNIKKGTSMLHTDFIESNMFCRLVNENDEFVLRQQTSPLRHKDHKVKSIEELKSKRKRAIIRKHEAQKEIEDLWMEIMKAKYPGLSEKSLNKFPSMFNMDECEIIGLSHVFYGHSCIFPNQEVGEIVKLLQEASGVSDALVDKVDENHSRVSCPQAFAAPLTEVLE